jgi:hypothetical protein
MASPLLTTLNTTFSYSPQFFSWVLNAEAGVSCISWESIVVAFVLMQKYTAVSQSTSIQLLLM